MTNARNFWDERAALGARAGTDDLIAAEIERRAIAEYVRNGMRILDAGCGTGQLAVELATKYAITIVGFDASEEMINIAQRRLAAAKHVKSLRFGVAHIEYLGLSFSKDVDLAITERVLINLPDWSVQAAAIRALCAALKPSGQYVMVENTVEGLSATNSLRVSCGLPEIVPPWHNRYLVEAELEALAREEGLLIEERRDITSTYAFLSRVVNAALAQREGRDPAYDAPVNQLALTLPEDVVLGLGQTKLWVWRRA